MKNLYRIQRYCTRCGHRMRKRSISRGGETRYHPQTGHAIHTFDVFWACMNFTRPLVYYDGLTARTTPSYHDGEKIKNSTWMAMVKMVKTNGTSS